MKHRIEWWSIGDWRRPIAVDVEAATNVEAEAKLSAALTKLVADAEPDVCHPGAACSKPETRSKPTPNLFCPTCPDVERAHATMLANLTDVQKRCTELVEELRVERAKASGPALTGPMRLVSSNIDRPLGAEDSQILCFACGGIRIVMQAEGVLADSDALFAAIGKTFVLAPEHQDVTAMRERAEKAEADLAAAKGLIRNGIENTKIVLDYNERLEAQVAELTAQVARLSAFGETMHRVRAALEGSSGGVVPVPGQVQVVA